MHIPHLLIFLALMPLAGLAQQETRLESRISQVTVYRQRAQISRQAEAQVRQGDNLLVFSGLSRNLVPNSITVSGTGEGVIQAVSHRVSYLNKTIRPPRMIVLEDSICLLERRVNALADARFVNEAEEKLLLENDEVAGENDGLSPEALRQMAALYRERLTALRDERRDIAQQERQAQRLLAAYVAEVQTIAAQRDQPTQEVVVAFQAPKAGKISLELHYLVSQAGWTPFYDVRVDNTTDPLQFFLKAQVMNNTGVDWTGVALTLSTTNNNANNNSPTLSPWYVSIGYPQPSPRYSPSPSRRDMIMESNVMDAEGPADREEDAQATYAFDYTTISENELGLDFVISLPYDIPADGKEHQVDVQLIKVAGEFQHYTVPKLDRDAFLVAQIQQDLLRGKANVYFEGSFVGETYVNTDTPRDSMRISLGRDPRVQVQRAQVQDYTDRKVVGSTVRQTYGYAITLRNNKRTAVSITVEDQLPVSQNKDIAVVLLTSDGAVQDSATGRLQWLLTLAPGETRELKFQFEVKYPKNQPVQGL
ncbi:MAG: mucoidy inhibitor MuiA [Bacteroidia bacterium]